MYDVCGLSPAHVRMDWGVGDFLIPNFIGGPVVSVSICIFVLVSQVVSGLVSFLICVS